MSGRRKKGEVNSLTISGNGKETTVSVDDLTTAAGAQSLYYKLRLPGSANQHFDIPGEEEFEVSEFISAEEDLREFYDALREHFHDYFWHLEDANVRLFWKAKGGSSGGSNTWGKCLKPTGLLRHYATADFIIWLAADHCRNGRFTNWVILALLYHEMRHTKIGEKYEIQTHEFEGWSDEIENFGAWRVAAQKVISAARKLPGFE